MIQLRTEKYSHLSTTGICNCIIHFHPLLYSPFSVSQKLIGSDWSFWLVNKTSFLNDTTFDGSRFIVICCEFYFWIWKYPREEFQGILCFSKLTPCSLPGSILCFLSVHDDGKRSPNNIYGDFNLKVTGKCSITNDMRLLMSLVFLI